VHIVDERGICAEDAGALYPHRDFARYRGGWGEVRSQLKSSAVDPKAFHGRCPAGAADRFGSVGAFTRPAVN